MRPWYAALEKRPEMATSNGSNGDTPRIDGSDDKNRHAFIDRVKVLVAHRHIEPICVYQNLGVEEKTGEIARASYSFSKVPGHYDCACVKTAYTTDFSHLVMDFCPGKYLSGNNLFGPQDLSKTVTTVVPDILRRLNLRLSAEEEELLFAGTSRLYRVDSTALQSIGTDEAVNAYLDELATGRHQTLKRRTTEPGSVTFGKPDYYKVVIYNKHQELVKKAGIWGEIYGQTARQLLLDEAVGMVRTEVQMRSKKLLYEGLSTVADWTPLTPGNIVRKNQRLIKVNECHSLPPQMLSELKKQTQAVYRMWLDGIDPKTHYSRSGLRPHREALLAVGIDITVRHTGKKLPQQESLSCSQILEMPYEPPSEKLIESGLYVQL